MVRVAKDLRTVHRYNGYIQKALASPVSIEVNFADDDVLALSKIYKKVSNERTHILQFVRFEHLPVNLKTGRIAGEQQDKDEKAFQDLWKEYLQSITIQSRKNLRLQRQFMPKRFWKYLIEK